MKAIPNRPAITNVLLRASANIAFRMKLLSDPCTALTEMKLPPEDVELLSTVRASTLKEYAHQIKLRLTAEPREIRELNQ